MPLLLEVYRIDDFIIAVVLVPVEILCLPTVSRAIHQH
jgi:hypothetical protein